MAEQGGTPGPSSRNRIVAAVVVSVLVTASAAGGVGAVAELSDPDSSVVEQLTTDAPNETTQPQFPPGTNESGVTNATALLQAHHSTLQNTSYSAEVVSEDVSFVADANRTGGEWERSPFTVAVEKGDAGTSISLDDQEDHFGYWMTENTTATRNVQSERNVTTAAYQYEENGTYGFEILGSNENLETLPTALVAPYVAGVDYAYQGTVTHGNETLHRFASTGVDRSVDNTVSSQFPSTVESVSTVLLVDERGVIREVNAAVEYTRENETVTARTNYSVSGVGETTTSEPPWVAAKLSRFDVSVTDDGRVLAMQYTGGRDPTDGTQSEFVNGTQSGADVFVRAPNVNSNTTLTTPLTPGDTVYLWSVNGTAELRSSVNDPPSVNESFVAFGSERAAVSLTRYEFTSHRSETTNSYSTIELWMLNETTMQNGLLAEMAAQNGALADAVTQNGVLAGTATNATVA